MSVATGSLRIDRANYHYSIYLGQKNELYAGDPTGAERWLVSYAEIATWGLSGHTFGEAVSGQTGTLEVDNGKIHC